jgi:chaperonin GroEL (HSP60 family)
LLKQKTKVMDKEQTDALVSAMKFAKAASEKLSDLIVTKAVFPDDSDGYYVVVHKITPELERIANEVKEPDAEWFTAPIEGTTTVMVNFS